MEAEPERKARMKISGMDGRKKEAEHGRKGLQEETTKLNKWRKRKKMDKWEGGKKTGK